MPDALQGADHFKPHAIQENRASNRGPAREQRSPRFVSQDDDTTGLYFIHLVEPTPAIDGDVADAAEVGTHSIDLAARLKVVADGTNVIARNDRSRTSDAWTFGEHVFVIPGGQVILAQCREAALDRRSATRPDKQDILSNRVKLLPVAGAESFAQSYQQQQGTHAPGNPEHGKERTQFVRPESLQGLAEDVEDNAHATL